MLHTILTGCGGATKRSDHTRSRDVKYSNAIGPFFYLSHMIISKCDSLCGRCQKRLTNIPPNLGLKNNAILCLNYLSIMPSYVDICRTQGVKALIYQ